MFRQKVRKVNHNNEFVEGTGTFYKFGYQDLIDILAGQFIPVQVAGY